MNRQRFQRAATAFISTLVAFFGGLVASGFGPNADSALGAKPKPIVVLSSPGSDAIWGAVERIATEMKFREVVQTIRALAGDAPLDGAKPFGLVLATNGDSFIPFAFVPVASPESGTLDAFVDAAEARPQLRGKLVRTDAGTFFGADKRVELLEKNGWIFAFYPAQKELVPTSDPTSWIGGAPEGGTILTLDANIAAVPEEFVEAAFAKLRQQAAQTGGEIVAAGGGDDALKSLDATLRYYSEFVAALERVGATVQVDPENGNLVVDYSFVFKSGSPLQETLEAAKGGKTSWGAVLETPNAVFATAGAGKYAARDRAFLADYYKTTVFANIERQLETALDDPKALETARNIAEAFENAALSQLESGESDAATALSGGETPTFVFATRLTNVDETRRGLRLLADAIRDGVDAENAEFFDRVFKRDEKTVDGFSVSTFDLPIREIPNAKEGAPAFFADKTLAARIGIADDALLIVAGLDAAATDAEFGRIAADRANGEKTPNPQETALAFAPIGAFLAAALKDAPNVRPTALEIFERIADAEGAKIEVATRVDGTRLDIEYVLTAEIFQVVGDAIRIQTLSGSGDAGEDVDDLFDDVEE